MKTTLPLLAALLCCWFLPAVSEAASPPDCPDSSCFDTQIISRESQDGCTTYTLKISTDGDCRYALSHFSVEIPCGNITEVSNSEGWAMEVGTTDPTTGITGIKVDDIRDFGEQDQPESFTLTYTVCNQGSCSPEDLFPPRVAYKAATCVHYQELKPPYTPMSVRIAANDLLCAGDSSGSIELEISGGEAPFTYSWSNGATTEDLSGLAAGTYAVNITDASGAMLTAEATVTEPQPLQVAAALTPIDCNGAGSITPTPSGGTAPYSYNWSDGTTAETLQNATAGTYSLLLTDANGCTLEQSFVIEDRSLQLSIAGGESCDNSELQAVLTGGTAPFSYQWSSGETTAAITPAESGTYSLTVTDAAGCSLSSSLDYTAGASFSASLSSTDPSCAYGSDGSIDLSIEGGSGDYTYEWSNGATTEDLDSLDAGTYTVTVTDASGCALTLSATISNPRALFIRYTELLQPDCHGNGGSITAAVSYGTAPYTFEWSNGETGESISNLEPGVYIVTATDANGCSRSRSFTLQEPDAPQLSLSGGSCGSTLTSSVSGGTEPYTYEWNTGDSTATIDYTSGGTFTLTVTDANGCSSSDSLTVTDPVEAITLSHTTTGLLCSGDSNGSIDLTVTGGSEPYTYEWSNGDTTEDLDSLSAGTYTVNVTDANGCTATASITISAPRSIFIRPLEVSNINCQGEGGFIHAEALFGTAPYSYEWSNGDTTATADSLTAGYHTLVVTDANGCSSQRRFYISEEEGPTVSISAAGCGNTYELTAQVAGGSTPYAFEWNNGETTPTISAAPGSYTVSVIDANGCSSTAAFTLEESATPLSLQASLTHVSCAGGSNGAASLQVFGGVAPYTFDWSNGSSSQTVSELTAGMYSVQVRDANGCSEVLAFTLTEPQPLSLTAVVTNNQACGNRSNGSIEVSVSGGTAPYTYLWNTADSTASLSGLSSGSYTVSVADANECVSIRSFTIEDEVSGTAAVAFMESCADTLICSGSTTGLPVYFEGEGPYTLRYRANGQEHSLTTSANPYVLEVSPLSKTTYSLLGVSSSCGEGTASGQATIQVSDCNRINVCEESCFSTQLLSRTTDGSCQTVTLQVNSDGDCRYALSHFNIALGCGTASEVSNSGNWPMEVNAYDPTTGLYGIKIDEIQSFGEGSEPQSFTVTYTLCSGDTACLEAADSCEPLVAYKAGTCVTYDKAGNSAAPELPGDGWGEVSSVSTEADFTLFPNPYQENQQLKLSLQNLTREGKARVIISTLTGVEIHQSEQQVGPQQSLIQLQLDRQLPGGSYIVRLQVEGQTITKQLHIL